jgi:hypothetical protein
MMMRVGVHDGLVVVFVVAMMSMIVVVSVAVMGMRRVAVAPAGRAFLATARPSREDVEPEAAEDSVLMRRDLQLTCVPEDLECDLLRFGEKLRCGVEQRRSDHVTCGAADKIEVQVRRQPFAPLALETLTRARRLVD